MDVPVGLETFDRCFLRSNFLRRKFYDNSAILGTFTDLRKSSDRARLIYNRQRDGKLFKSL